MKEDTLFWDVDTQFDFMRPEGKLYVPGAETIIDKVSEVRKFALDNGYSIIADIDWHSADNDEISETPDFERTFPPHCLAGESGSERVGFLGELPIEYVEITKTEHDTLRRLISKKQFHVVIKKDALDVFSNPNTSELVKHIGLKNVIIFGVALDFCVDCVVRGLSSLSDIRLCVLNDAVKGLGTRPESEIFDEYAQMGIEIAEFNTVREKLLCGC